MEEKRGKIPYSITYGLLALFIIIFILGIVGDEIIHNIFKAESIRFSTISLLAFIFGVILSSASIVLAVTAIILGKNSEYAMTERSDQSINLQNQIFSKTTEALAKIEASTGVTEKRIEDIISGRVGAISHKLAEIAIADTGKSFKDRAMLEEEIRQSILKEFKESKEDEEKERKRLEEIEKDVKAYKQYHSKVLSALSEKEWSKIAKLGDGNYRKDGDELFDCIFIKNGNRIGVSALPNITEDKKEFLIDYFIKVAKQIDLKKYSKIYLIINENSEMQNEIESKIKGQISIVKEEVLNSINIIVGETEEIEQLISIIDIN